MGQPQLNQDPRWRAMVLPVFRFDPNSPEDRPFGLGTTFRIDPWVNCATAFHVVEDMLTLEAGIMKIRDNVRVAALEIEGIVFGSPPLPEGRSDRCPNSSPWPGKPIPRCCTRNLRSRT